MLKALNFASILAAGYETADYVFCPIVEQLAKVPQYAHPAVPTSIADSLNHLHGAPSIWVSGHLIAYILRLQSGEIADSMNNILKSIRDPSDPSPFVGVHVRRTDKVRLFAFNSINFKFVDSSYCGVFPKAPVICYWNNRVW